MDKDLLKNKKIVCLGGGIGTVNLIRGLHAYTKHITVVVSMADEGGSAGRLRRLYNTMPPGDIVSCMSALSGSPDHELYAQFLTYRFPGDRYGKDTDLGGHKIGNLMMFAAAEVTGSFEGAIGFMKKLFQVQGEILPATVDHVSIDAKTVEGVLVKGEENIDLGQYEGKRVLEHVYLHPEDAKAPDEVIEALSQADAVVVGPGDLYTTLLPVLIVPAIREKLLQIQTRKIFVVNVANKPFETKGYSEINFIEAVVKHLGGFPFDTVVVNNNFSLPIPNPYHYSYVGLDEEKVKELYPEVRVIADDLVKEEFPLYHNSEKLAYLVAKNI